MRKPNFRDASCFIMFSALSEIILSLYENTKSLIFYDKDLHLKFKNLKASFESISKKAHLMFPENEQLSFMKMITVFEQLIEAAKEQKKFMELMGLIEAWHNGEITMINTKDRLIEVAEELKNGKEIDEL